MYFVIRVDSSSRIGTGHLMRCLTLATALQKKGADVTFICRSSPGNLINFLQKRDFEVCQLISENTSTNEELLEVSWEIDLEQTKVVLDKQQRTINWLIVDHYSLDYRWESQLKPYVQKLMVIDDLANRNHECDLLLDQNYYHNFQTRYDYLVPVHCQKLLGTQHVLLRDEFIAARQRLQQRDGNIKRILIFFGGSDLTNETAKALEAIKLLNRPDITVDVVVGQANQHKYQVRQLCQAIPNTTFYCQVTYIADLIAKADLALAAGGTNTWERCFLGLPCITLAIAPNQLEAIAALAAQGAISNLGWCNDVKAEDIYDEIARLINNPQLLIQMSLASQKLMNISTNFNSVESIITVLMSPELSTFTTPLSKKYL